MVDRCCTCLWLKVVGGSFLLLCPVRVDAEEVTEHIWEEGIVDRIYASNSHDEKLKNRWPSVSLSRGAVMSILIHPT